MALAPSPELILSNSFKICSTKGNPWGHSGIATTSINHGVLKMHFEFLSKGNANSRHYRYSCQKYSAHIKTPTLGKFINTEVLESFLQIRPRNHHYTTVPCFTICLQNWEPMAIRTEKISPLSYSSIWTTVQIVACLNRNSSTNSSFVSISQKHDFALLSKNLKLGI